MSFEKLTAMRRSIKVLIVLFFCFLSSSGFAASDKYGVNHDFFLWASVPDSTLEIGKNIGFGWARILVPWYKMQPDESAPINWDLVEQQINALKKQDYMILVSFFGVPSWAAGKVTKHCHARHPWVARENAVPPRDSSLFRNFVSEFSAHFAGRVNAYDFWIEPNTCYAWRGRPSDWRRLIFEPGFDAVKSTDPTAEISGPGVTPGHRIWPWISRRNQQGRAVLTRNINQISFDTYEGVRGDQKQMLSRSKYPLCNGDQSYCVQDYVVTEFSFASGNCQGASTPRSGHQSSPGRSTVEVMSFCKNDPKCKRIFLWDIWRPVNEECQYALLVTNPPVPADDKFSAIAEFLRQQ